MTAFRPDESLGYLVNRTARLFARALDRRLRRHGVGIGQWAVLVVLYQRDGRTQADLSRTVAIEPPTMVRTIDRMTRDGLVERRHDARDARVVRIHLTERSSSLRERLFAEARAVNAEAVRVLGVDDHRATMESLRRLLAAMSEPDPGAAMTSQVPANATRRRR